MPAAIIKYSFTFTNVPSFFTLDMNSDNFATDEAALNFAAALQVAANDCFKVDFPVEVTTTKIFSEDLLPS